MSKTILAELDGWTPVIDTVVEACGPIAALVFGRVWRYCQMTDGVCYASQDRIAAELHVSRSCINENISRLVAAGFLGDLTPELRNKPHTYADTGKAGLKITIAAKKAPVSLPFTVVPDDSRKPVTVVAGDTTVAGNDTKVSSGTTPTVVFGDMKKVLRESLRDEKRDSSIPNPETAWAMVRDQLRAQMSRGDYLAYVDSIRPVSAVGDAGSIVFTVTGPDDHILAWAASRLERTITRLLTAVYSRPARIVFVMAPAAQSINSC